MPAPIWLYRERNRRLTGRVRFETYLERTGLLRRRTSIRMMVEESYELGKAQAPSPVTDWQSQSEWRQAIAQGMWSPELRWLIDGKPTGLIVVDQGTP